MRPKFASSLHEGRSGLGDFAFGDFPKQATPTHASKIRQSLLLGHPKKIPFLENPKAGSVSRMLEGSWDSRTTYNWA